MKKTEYKPPVYIGQNIYIKPSYVVSIPEFYKDRSGISADSLLNQKNLLNNDHNGKLSRKAITGLRNSINWLCMAAKKKRVFNKEKNTNFFFKVNFITLTLPDTAAPISSNDLQRQLLNPFLTYMRKFHNLKNYVWRLEFQANGKLHVHLTTDSFIHLKTVRNVWNRLLDNNGYLNEFVKIHGHKNPNSTDIHATKKIKNIAAYLAKYMSKKGNAYKIAKKPKNPAKWNLLSSKQWYIQRLNFWNSPHNPRPIKGRIWFCSKELSKALKLVVHIPADQAPSELKCLMNKEIEYKEILTKVPPVPEGIENQNLVKKAYKIGEVYFLKAKDWLDKITGVIKEKFEETRYLISKESIQTHVFAMS